MDKYFDRKKEVEEITKTYGGKTFFSELVAARVPFFFTAAVKNTAEDTEYMCEAITPNSMGIPLTDDKFVDFLNIRNNGFITIPSFDMVSPSVQGLKLFQEEGQRQNFYSQEVLAKFNEEKMAMIEDGAELEDGEWMAVQPAGQPEVQPEGGIDEPSAAQSVLESVMQNVIIGPGPDDGFEGRETEQIQVPVFHGETLDITWGGGTGQPKDYQDEFAQIDARHQKILKGDGSFLQAKEREAVYYNMNQQPGQENAGNTAEAVEAADGDTLP